MDQYICFYNVNGTLKSLTNKTAYYSESFTVIGVPDNEMLNIFLWNILYEQGINEELKYLGEQKSKKDDREMILHSYGSTGNFVTITIRNSPLVSKNDIKTYSALQRI